MRHSFADFMERLNISVGEPGGNVAPLLDQVGQYRKRWNFRGPGGTMKETLELSWTR